MLAWRHVVSSKSPAFQFHRELARLGLTILHAYACPPVRPSQLVRAVSTMCPVPRALDRAAPILVYVACVGANSSPFRSCSCIANVVQCVVIRAAFLSLPTVREFLPAVHKLYLDKIGAVDGRDTKKWIQTSRGKLSVAEACRLNLKNTSGGRAVECRDRDTTDFLLHKNIDIVQTAANVGWPIPEYYSALRVPRLKPRDASAAVTYILDQVPDRTCILLYLGLLCAYVEYCLS